jgi:hypothetical protein
MGVKWYRLLSRQRSQHGEIQKALTGEPTSITSEGGQRPTVEVTEQNQETASALAA